jgi:hypothetical protein
MDEKLAAFLQEGREVLVPYLVKIFYACLAPGYALAMWRQIKVVFIPKPGRKSYGGPRDFILIRLTPFLLKTMGRLLNRIDSGAQATSS